MYSDFLKWSSMCRNLKLSELVSDSALGRLKVHYGFLSAFTHATRSGYGVDRFARPGAPRAAHVLGELVLLYAAEMAVAEIDAWRAYLDQRPHLLEGLRIDVLDAADEVRTLTSYFWFFGGGPQPFDFFQEANRRAGPLLLVGERPQFGPNDIAAEEVTYYGNPFERLRSMHVGGSEMTTGFGYAAAWPRLNW